MSKRTFTDEQVIKSVLNKSNVTIKHILDEIGGSISGSTYRLIHNVVKKYNLNTSHWLGVKINKGKTFGFKRGISYYLKKTTIKKISSHNLKNRLIKENIKKHKCEKCNNEIWNNKKIPLQLHHINGQKFDNRLKNLEILCPNCHAQTDNYCALNKKSYKSFPSIRDASQFD